MPQTVGSHAPPLFDGPKLGTHSPWLGQSENELNYAASR